MAGGIHCLSKNKMWTVCVDRNEKLNAERAALRGPVMSTNTVTPSSLEIANAHERDEHITFHEGPHVYTLANSAVEFTSVTALVHQQFEPFDAERILDSIFSRDPVAEKYRGETKESLRDAWERNRVEASAAGTLLHKDIEDFFNGGNVTNESTEWGYFTDFHAANPHVKPYRTEWVVYDESIALAGSIDLVTENDDGTLSIYDWKRSKEIRKTNRYNRFSTNPRISHVPDANFWHYSLQLNIYRSILERKYGRTVKELFLVCLHPNHSSYQLIKCPDLRGEVAALFAARGN